MKSKKKFLFSAGIVLLVAVVLFLFFYTQSMHSFFSGWEQEANPPVAMVEYDAKISYGEMVARLQDDGEPLVVYNDRIYAFSSTWADDAKYFKAAVHMGVTLFSVNLAGLDYKELYSGEFLINRDDLKLSPIRNISSYVSSKEGYTSEYGVYYYNNSVFLRDQERCVEYDLASGTTTEYAPEKAPFPYTKYWLEATLDKPGYTIGDRTTGEQRIISLVNMAEKHHYANKILQAFRKKDFAFDNRLDENTSDFFAKAYVIDDSVYLVCQIRNFMGESFAVVFMYSFEEDKYDYIGYRYIGDVVHSNFSLIPWLEKAAE